MGNRITADPDYFENNNTNKCYEGIIVSTLQYSCACVTQDSDSTYGIVNYVHITPQASAMVFKIFKIILNALNLDENNRVDFAQGVSDDNELSVRTLTTVI